MNILPKEFYQRDTVIVAKDLLGKKLVRKNNQLYFLTIHPAATIYNQKLINVLKKDIKKLLKIIKELKNNKKVKIDIEYTS